MIGFARQASAMPHSIARAAGGAGVFALALVAAAASAADKPAKDTAAKSAQSTLLTPAQARECLAQRNRLHAQIDDALKDKAAIEADKTEIARSGTALGEQVATLDKTKAEEVDAYNAKVEERDKLIDSYQAKVSVYNTKAEAVKESRASYEKLACENRSYDERQLNDPKRKK